MIDQDLAKINKFFEQFNIQPDDINKGDCYHWAMIANILYGGELYSNNRHAFLKLKNKYYDSECLFGTESWRDIPTINRRFKRGLNVMPAFRFETNDFIEYWMYVGRKCWNQNLITRGVRFVRNFKYDY